MKPKKLRIMGLNSFTEEQTIDFEKLTEKGLFGIFGPTGSGKSSILDAMTIALYGKISRGTNEFINTEMNELAVEFEFEIGSKLQRKTYSVERHMKRDKNTRGYNTDKAMITEKAADSVNVLCDNVSDVNNKVVEIIGLSNEDFTRSVVLPQGKFNEFLKLRGSNRSKMLERIFGLEKYGSKMSEKIKEMRKKCENNKSYIEGQLNRYEGVSEAELKQEKDKLNILASEVEELKKKKERLMLSYEKFKNIWQLQEELKQYEKKEQELSLKKGDADAKRIKVKRAKDAEIIRPFIEAKNDTDGKLVECSSSIKKLVQNESDITKALTDVEKKYNDAYDLKETKLPKLLEVDAKLKQAIEIQEEINKLKSERNELAGNYKSALNKINEYNAELSKVDEGIDKAKAAIEGAEARLEEIKISPEHRESVSEAVVLEKEYKGFRKKLIELQSKLKDIKLRIEKSKSEYENIMASRSKIEEELRLKKSERENLIKGCPGDNNLIISKKEKINEIEIRLNEAETNLAKWNSIQESNKSILSKNQELQGKIDKLNTNLSEKKEYMGKLKKGIHDIEFKNRAALIAAELNEGEPCPVCGSLHHVKVVPHIEEGLLTEKENESAALNEQIEAITNELGKSNVELGVLNRELSINAEGLEDISKKLEGICIEDLKAILDHERKNFDLLLKSMETWEENKNSIDASITKLEKENEENNIRLTAVREGMNKDEEVFNNGLNDLAASKEETEDTENRMNVLLSSLKVSSAEEEMMRINGLLREENILRKKIQSFRNDLKIYDDEKTRFQKQRNNCELERARLEESGKEKKLNIESREAKLSELCDGREPSTARLEIGSEIEKIKKAEADLKKALEECRTNEKNIREEKASEEKKLNTLTILLDEQNKKLLQMLKETSFKDCSEVNDYVLDKGSISKLEADIKNYDNGMEVTASNIIRIKSKISGEKINEDEWNSLLNDKKGNEMLLEQKQAVLAGNQNTVDIMERELKEVKKLNEQMKDARHQLDLLDELSDLTKGNKFVEYASMNQLKLIALEASRQLREITSGRYSLEFDSTGEFVIRDDYNGGIRRAVDTLSGGETFLTSLSLAIALSTHIQLKGNATLEFFFLDEGFGTLDSVLLETVMTSLEKLQNDRLSVGIISHVDELKNRVPVKLMVTPAMAGIHGTEVKIEYT